MLSLAKRLQLQPLLLGQLRSARTRPKSAPVQMKRAEERSEWWAVDGEMHEIGDHVPARERFVIPRENIPNKRRKQLRDQFMRRTRLVLKEFRSYNPQFDHMKGAHMKKRLKHMVKLDENCETRVEDVAWLCSLSESEIDMLIALKLLIIQRAKMIGCKELAKKFTLKMIRAIALVLMENLKAEIKDSSRIPNTVKSSALLDSSNLLKCTNKVDADIYELSAILGADIEKLLRSPRTPKRKKQKVGSSSE